MTYRTPWLTGIVLVLCLMAMLGCKPPKSKSEALLDPLSPSAYPQIAALDGVGRSMSFMSPASSPQSDGRVKIVIPVTSRDSQSREVSYKFEFFDSKGRPRPQQEDWKFMRIPPRTTRHLETLSPDSNTRNWRLVIRPAQGMQDASQPK